MFTHNLCAALYLFGLFVSMGPFASVWLFYTYIAPFTTTLESQYGSIMGPFNLRGF